MKQIVNESETSPPGFVNGDILLKSESVQKCHTHKSGEESTGTKIKNVLGGQGRGESDILKNHAESSQEKLVVKTCGKKIKIKQANKT